MTTPRHTEDFKSSEDQNTGPRKTLAKNAKNVMFYQGGGGEGGQRSEDFNGLQKLLYIYEDTRVLGSISNSRGGEG